MVEYPTDNRGVVGSIPAWTIMLPLEECSNQRIKQLVLKLKKDGVIIFPTDTVYALCANAFSSKAMQRIIDIKQRSAEKNFNIIFGSQKPILEWMEVSVSEKELLDKYFPGKITLLLRPKPQYRKYFPSMFYGEKIGCRITSNKYMQELAKCIPIIATSCNYSGKPPIQSIKQLPSQIEKQVDEVIDAGIINGIPTTIIEETNGKIKVHREGEITIGKRKI